MPNVAMKHEKDPRTDLLEQIGDLSKYQLAAGEVLLITYLRPEQTRGGIIIAQQNLQEDYYQSKAHLVAKIGPGAEFYGLDVNEHDWVVIRPSDGWALMVNQVHCRHINGKHIKAVIQHPEVIW